MTKAMLEGMSTSSTQTKAFKDFSFGDTLSSRSTVKEHLASQHKMVMANGDELDLSWLLSSG
jgi:hypothetical protein